MFKNQTVISRAAYLLVLVLIVTFALVGCGGGTDTGKDGEGGQLNIYTWAEMFPPEILDGFTEETGIEINYVNFDTDETMLAKLEAAEGGKYDLIIADDYIIETAISEKLVQELDTSKLANFSNINPVYQGQFYDPDDKYTIPYGAGVQTILYNTDKVKKEIEGYADLWDSSLKDSLGIIGNYRVINGMALKVNGESYNTDDLDAIKAAGDKLIGLAPNIRLIKDDELQNDILTGEINAGVMYTSQVTQAMQAAQKQDMKLKVVYPKEGIGFGIMAGFIPAKAPNADAAYKFLDYILDAENAAKCFEWIGYYSTNAAADQFISDNMKEFLTLPVEFNKDEMEMIQNVSPEAEDKHVEVWTAFKKAAGQE